MAEQTSINRLRLLVGTEYFDDAAFAEVLDTVDGDIDEAAAMVWEIRAGKYHTLVNVSESGSSRNLGDMYKNAMTMANFYRAKQKEEEVEEIQGITRTRRITRP